MPQQNPLHEAALDGRAADLGMRLRKEEEQGTLAGSLAEREGVWARTPLDASAHCARPEGAAADGARLLLAAGADAAAADRDGRTAMHRVARYGPDDPRLVGLLMGAGCDPAARTSRGNTALSLAKRHNRPRVAALLEAALSDAEVTLAPFRAELAALHQLAADRGIGGVGSLQRSEQLAAVREHHPEYDAEMEVAMRPVHLLEQTCHRLAEADQELPRGTRICISGYGCGSYVRITYNNRFCRRGPNQHTIAFDSGQTSAVKLLEEDWAVTSAEMDAMDTYKPMHITVKNLFDKAIALDVHHFHTVGTVKAMIEERDGTPAGSQRLLFNKAPLEDSLTLQGSGVEDGDILFLSYLAKSKAG